MLPTTLMASITPADALSSQVSRHPMTSRTTLGYGAFHQHRLSLTLSTSELINFAFVLLLFNLLNVFAIQLKVFSPASLTEGLRPRPTWHLSSIPQKRSDVHQ